jgi:hypothetical protein
MSAFHLALLSETALYGLLAYTATITAKDEEEAGRHRFCHHHRLAAALYILLGAFHLLHG